MGKRVTIKEFIGNLYADEIDSTSIRVDWSETIGEDCEGWRAYEVQKCDECGEYVCSGGRLGEDRHCDIEDESECDGYLNFDGPLMNYFYPCDFRRVGGIEAAAEAIKDTACVAVELRDGSTGFALAGGGMDLTWDIASAYVVCGQLPPVAFTRLPRFADAKMTTHKRRIIAACIKSNQVMINRAKNNKRDLMQLRKIIGERPNGKKAA